MISYNLLITGHVYFMYLIKGIQYGFWFASLYIAERLFTDLYMKKVYAENQQAPNLFGMLGILLGMHVAMNAVFLVFLFMLMLLFKRQNNNFIVNEYTIWMYVKDYAACLLYLAILSSIIVGIMQQKKYFRYRTEGLRAIRGLSEILTYVGIIIFLLPFFYLIA